MRPPLVAAAVLTGLAFVLASACGGTEEAAAPGTSTPSTSPHVSPTASAKPTPTAAGTPTAWKTFTNTAYGYSFQYPADWLLNPYEPDSDASTSSYVSLYNVLPTGTSDGSAPPASELKIEIVVLGNPSNLPLEQWVAAHNQEDPNQAVVRSLNTISVNGVPAVQQLASSAPFEYYTVYISQGSRIYIINGPQSNSMFLGLYDRLLHSFQLAR